MAWWNPFSSPASVSLPAPGGFEIVTVPHEGVRLSASVPALPNPPWIADTLPYQPSWPAPIPGGSGAPTLLPLFAHQYWRWWWNGVGPSDGAHIEEPLDKKYYVQAFHGQGSRLLLNRPTLRNSAEDPRGRHVAQLRDFRLRRGRRPAAGTFLFSGG